MIRGDGVNVAQVLYLKSRDVHEQRANGRLIAAAPEMLALFRKITDGQFWPTYLQADARALLARIEGKETQP